jgi:two-component system, LytTR family, response regulator
MPTGSGFDFLNSFQKRNFKVIFTTASEEYLLKAIQIKVDNYLLKPIDLTLLTNALSDIRAEITEQILATPIHLIPLPIQGGFTYLKPEEVINLSSNGNYTTVFTKGNKKHLVSKNLGFFSAYFDELPFFKCHQSHIINLNEVVELQKADGGFVVMSNGNKIEVSRANKSQLIFLLNK